MKNTLAERLEHLLKNLNVRQQDFARKIGYTQSYISQILSGIKKNPNVRFYEAVSRIFSVNIKWLREGEGKIYSISNQEIFSLDAEHIIKYKMLPKTDQKLVDEVINAFLIKNTAKE